ESVCYTGDRRGIPLPIQSRSRRRSSSNRQMMRTVALDTNLTGLPDPLLHLRDVGKYVESKAGRINLLSHVDLAIRPGEFVSIMGPSGAGKTTRLNILAVFVGDFTGEDTFAGCDVMRMRQEELREL